MIYKKAAMFLQTERKASFMVDYNFLGGLAAVNNWALVGAVCSSAAVKFTILKSIFIAAATTAHPPAFVQ